MLLCIAGTTEVSTYLIKQVMMAIKKAAKHSEDKPFLGMQRQKNNRKQVTTIKMTEKVTEKATVTTVK